MQLPLAQTRILISGAGVAGPALACSLQRYGARVTLVEVAPALREGGFAVDFRGPTHQRVLAELGVLEPLRAIRTHGSPMRAVDQHGREIFCLPAEFAGGELEVYRGDLSRVFYERSLPHAEYLFGDRIAALRQSGSSVEVEFARAGTRQFDLVVGCDGIHSNVRKLVFGPEQRYVKHLGYYIAGWSLPNTLAVDAMYSEPGRTLGIGPDQRDPSRAIALGVFASDQADIDWRDTAAHKALVKRAFAGMPWHAAEILATLDDATDLYFDAISRVHVPRWSDGRVALLGDAAWGVTLGGMGVGTGVVGGHVLAGELARVYAADSSNPPPQAAFAAYEQRLRGYAATWQKGADPGGFLAPKTRRGLWLRNTLLAMRPVQWLMLRMVKGFATDPELPRYEAYAQTAPQPTAAARSAL